MVLGVVRASGSTGAERDDEFSVANAAAIGEDGAGSAREQKPRRIPVTPPSDAIWITCENGVSQCCVGGGYRFRFCLAAVNLSFELIGQCVDTAGKFVPSVECCKQI